LAFIFQDPAFKDAVTRRASTSDILKEARRVEASIEQPSNFSPAKEKQ